MSARRSKALRLPDMFIALVSARLADVRAACLDVKPPAMPLEEMPLSLRAAQAIVIKPSSRESG